MPDVPAGAECGRRPSAALRGPFPRLIARHMGAPPMAEPIVCRLCGRSFAPRGRSQLRYCGTCRARVSRTASKAKRARCRQCGRAFSTRNLSIRYCSDPCRQKRYSRHRQHGWRRLPERSVEAECRICGKAFRTPTRIVKYCSDACRKKGYMRHAKPGRRPGRARAATAKCRVCGKAFAADLPGTPRVYCSDACRAEGRRTWIREYMRRYLADPEKRAIHAVRNAEAAARRRSEKK